MLFKLISTFISAIVGFYINLYFPLSIGIESFYTFSILMLFSNKFFEFFDIGSSATAFYIVIENKDNKFEIFNLYLTKASQYFGVTHSRQLFERAF